MRYIGRTLGALSGVALFPNLITAGLGFALGLVFDYAAQKNRLRYAADLVYQDLCLTYLALAASFASHGRSPQSSWAALRPQLVGRVNDIALAENYFHKFLRNPAPADQLAQELYAYVDGNPQQLSLFLHGLCELSELQGYSPTQQRILSALSELFEVDLPLTTPRAERITNEEPKTTEEPPPAPSLKSDALGGRNPYFVLGVASTATTTEIKSAYRKLVAKNHPDKLRGQGAGAKALKEAEEKMRVYNAAYDMLAKRQKE